MLTTVKRFAFIPLLALTCIWLGFALADNSPWGWAVGAMLFVQWAIVWDRRRQQRRISS